MRLAIAAAVVLLLAGPALAQEQSAEGEARSVSLMSAIGSFCPNVIPTDRAKAERLADAFTIVGRKMASPKIWSRVMLREGQRRVEEVKITGVQAWCENQRRYMRDVGAGEIFP